MLVLSLFSVASAAGFTAPVGRWTTLNDGKRFPSISLGTCCGSDPSIGLAPWLKDGGVGIDTSIDYRGAEVKIGGILAAEKVNRSDVYITTKVTAGCGSDVSSCAADPAVAIESVKTSLKNLGVDYIDMILLHRPCQQFSQHCSIAAKLSNCSGPNPIKDATAANIALWNGLQAARKQGLVRSIGVSNYFADELAALEGDKPAVNQCEMSIQGYDAVTIKYCLDNDILYQSYGAMRGCPFTDPHLKAIATTHGVSPAQVCLRWVLERGAVIASGTGADAGTCGGYTRDNLGIFNFTLSPPEVETLNNLQLQEEPKDVTTTQIHPRYPY